MTQPPADLEPALSPEDVAGLTGLCYQSVLAEIRAGALMAKKIRGRYLITRAAYDAWLDPGEPPRPRTVRALAAAPAARAVTRAAGVGSVAHLREILRGEQT